MKCFKIGFPNFIQKTILLQICDKIIKMSIVHISENRRNISDKKLAKVQKNWKYFILNFAQNIYLQRPSKVSWNKEEKISNRFQRISEKLGVLAIKLTRPPVDRQYESDQKAWERGGVGEKAIYQHTRKHIFLQNPSIYNVFL